MRAVICFFLLTISCSSLTAQEGNLQKEIELVIMTYNIHHGAGLDGVIDLQRIARVIMAEEPDLVALQEVDRFVRRTEQQDQAQILAELTGMHMAFGFAINYQGGDFGNVILSRYPLEEVKHHQLPGEPGEDRVLMEGLVTVPGVDDGVPVVFLATHLDTFREPRTASIPLILDVLPPSNDTLYILAGDLNDFQGSPVMDSLSNRLVAAAPPSLFTFPANKPDRQIDHIMYTPTDSWSVKDVYVVDEPVASDHAPLVARLVFDQVP